MRRIMILGNSGSGKSTLAGALAARLGAPVVHLDRLFWNPGWVQAPGDIFRERTRIAHAGDSWVSDGNYLARTFDLRLPRADLVILMETPRWRCLVRVIHRALSRRRSDDMAEGCEEKMGAEFYGLLRYIWAFDRDVRASIEAALAERPATTRLARIRNQRDLEELLSSL